MDVVEKFKKEAENISAKFNKESNEIEKEQTKSRRRRAHRLVDVEGPGQQKGT